MRSLLSRSWHHADGFENCRKGKSIWLLTVDTCYQVFMMLYLSSVRTHHFAVAFFDQFCGGFWIDGHLTQYCKLLNARENKIYISVDYVTSYKFLTSAMLGTKMTHNTCLVSTSFWNWTCNVNLNFANFGIRKSYLGQWEITLGSSQVWNHG